MNPEQPTSQPVIPQSDPPANPQITEPQSTTTPPTPTTPAQKKPKTKWLLIGLALVIIIAGGLAIFWPKSKTTTNSTTANNTSESEIDKTLSLTKLAVNTGFSNEKVGDIITNTVPDFPDTSSVDLPMFNYRPPNYTLTIDIYASSKLVFEDTNYDQKNYSNYTQQQNDAFDKNANAIGSLIGQIFTDNGYKQETNQPTEYIGSKLKYYSNVNYLCQVDINTAVTVSCATLKNINDTVTNFTPVISGIEDGKLSMLAVHWSGKIADSKTPGYRKTVVNMFDFVEGSGFALLMYEKDGKWHKFAGGQSEHLCSEYQKNPDFVKAFLGDDCGGADGQESTVK